MPVFFFLFLKNLLQACVCSWIRRRSCAMVYVGFIDPVVKFLNFINLLQGYDS